ncbi:MAG: SDR family NAD(P)-dependent oxidoreductase [Rhodospirillales bacterium]
MRLAGRRIAITGAASGIGRATAQLFRSEGAAVALLDRNVALLKATARELGEGSGPEVFHAEVEMADGASVEAAVSDAAEALGGLDGLVASAAIDLVKPFEAMSAADWDSIMTVNLSGPFHLCRAAVPFLRRAGGGTVVQISSGAGLRPLESRTAYCASKAGLVMFAKALAVDLAPEIRVNAICPGIVETPLFRQSIDEAPDPGAEMAKVLDRYLIRKPGRPLDIAEAALFLSSDAAAHITGIALPVDGGRAFH